MSETKSNEKIVIDKFYLVSILKMLFESYSKSNKIEKPIKEFLTKLGKTYHKELKTKSIKEVFYENFEIVLSDKYEIIMSTNELRAFNNLVNRIKSVSVPSVVKDSTYKEFKHILTFLK